MSEKGKGKREKGKRGRLGVGRSFLPLLLLTFHFTLLTSCGFYSFTGASIPEHLGSVAVPLVELEVQGSVPGLDQALTDALVERFADRTRLTLATDAEAADAVVYATLQRYTITPVAVTGDEVASLNRVSITVTLRYFDRVEDEEVVNRAFTASADYDPAENSPAAAEAEAAALAIDQLADDMFTAATSNW